MTPPRLFAAGLAAAALLVLPLLTFPAVPAHSYSEGAPSGFSGPDQYCNVCHTDPPGIPDSNLVNSGTGSVVITAPGTFAPGVPVPVTVEVNNTTPTNGPVPRQGFELSARDPDGAHVGTFVVDGTTVQFSPNSTEMEYVTHTGASNMDTTWTLAWVPPATDAPASVTFYAAGNAADGDFIGFGDNDDEIYADSLVLTRMSVSNEPEAPALAARLSAPFPNPVAGGADAAARYALDRPASVTARLLDGRGRVVRVLATGRRGAGAHALRIPTDGLPAGTYFVALSTPEGTLVQPLTVAR
jgi:hypothetical protein